MSPHSQNGHAVWGCPHRLPGDDDPAPLHRLGDVPRAVRALASQLAFGSSKPGRSAGDWRQTRSIDEMLAKILRHALARASGELLDEEGRPHSAAILADAAILLELEGGPP